MSGVVPSDASITVSHFTIYLLRHKWPGQEWGDGHWSKVKNVQKIKKIEKL
jgi:hypothetical protein